MSNVTIMWQVPYCAATTLAFCKIDWFWIVIVLCFWFAEYFVYCLFTGLVLESDFNSWEYASIRRLVERSVEKGRSQLCLLEKLSRIRFAKEINRLLCVSVSSFWCVMELLRIKNFLIGEGKILVGQKNCLSSPLTVKSLGLINQLFPEIGRPFRKWASLLVIYHVSLIVFVIEVSNPVHTNCQKSGSQRIPKMLLEWQKRILLRLMRLLLPHRKVHPVCKMRPWELSVLAQSWGMKTVIWRWQKEIVF